MAIVLPDINLYSDPVQLLIKQSFEKFPDNKTQMPDEVSQILNTISPYINELNIEWYELLHCVKIISGEEIISSNSKNIYIVQNGVLIINLTEYDGQEICLKTVKRGEILGNILNIMDIFIGDFIQCTKVTAKALEDSNILRLPVEALKEAIMQNEELLTCLALAAINRLQRITFTALKYIGLRKDLMKTVYSEENIVKAKDDEMKRKAIEGFMEQLGIEDDRILKKYIVVQKHPSNVCLTQENSLQADLYIVLSGSLILSQKHNILFSAYPGDIVGILAVTTGDPSLFSITTKHNTCIGIIEKYNIYELFDKYPKIILNLARLIIRRLTTFVRQIDLALDWIIIESGKALYRQDEDSDCMYILVNGRLRSVLTKKDGKKELVGEYGKGDVVGAEVLTESKRFTTVLAVRDSELIKLPEELLQTIKTKCPEVIQQLIHLIGDSILGSLQKGMTVTSERMSNLNTRPNGSNFATVAIMAVNKEVPLSEFTLELCNSLLTIVSDYILSTQP